MISSKYLHATLKSFELFELERTSSQLSGCLLHFHWKRFIISSHDLSTIAIKDRSSTSHYEKVPKILSSITKTLLIQKPPSHLTMIKRNWAVKYHRFMVSLKCQPIISLLLNLLSGTKASDPVHHQSDFWLIKNNPISFSIVSWHIKLHGRKVSQAGSSHGNSLKRNLLLSSSCAKFPHRSLKLVSCSRWSSTHGDARVFLISHSACLTT